VIHSRVQRSPEGAISPEGAMLSPAFRRDRVTRKCPEFMRQEAKGTGWVFPNES
jgi:hypothetical protein